MALPFANQLFALIRWSQTRPTGRLKAAAEFHGHIREVENPLLNPKSNSTNDSDSLYNLLKLSSEYTLLNDGVKPELVSQLFGDPQTSDPNAGSTAETENTDPASSVMDLLAPASNSPASADNSFQDILNLSSEYEMLKQELNEANASNTVTGDQNSDFNGDSTK